MESKDFVYEYMVPAKKVPSQQYGSSWELYWQNWKDEIIGFRPPRKGERIVSWCTGKDEIASCDFEDGNCRFILRPKPKVLRKYTVTVYDEPPRANGFATYVPQVRDQEYGGIWLERGDYASNYSGSNKRCEVKEEEV